MTTPNNMMFAAQSWQHQALVELTSMATSVIHGHYESPEDFAGEMRERATAIAHVLEGNQGHQLPMLLDCLGAHVFALQCAAYEHGKFAHESEADMIGRWQMSGYHAYHGAAPEAVAQVTSDAIAAIATHKVRNWQGDSAE